MSRPPSAEVERLFSAARALPAGDRGAYLEASDAPDDVRQEVAELLAADGAAEGYFDDLSREIAGDAMLEIERSARPAVRLGPWRATEVIGRGGMGVVYRGARDDGSFEQTVAIKLLHLDMETPELRARFLAERQLLARLDHPGVARLLDGGVTDEGRPYIVLEHVDGRPLDRHCREERLALETVLRTFLDVVDAVAYLHRNLVVHRDLKPSNVLVDREGRVKLLDFGIAKLLDGDEAAARTRTGRRLLTPEYASPEQLDGRPVTTASDVYALGAILYELLTGRRPRDPECAARTEATEVPTAPSAVLRAAPAEVSAPTWSRLDRDLDAVCLTALHPEPGRRYASAEKLGEDVERHLAGRPLRARPPTLAYRTRKFVRRNLPAVAAAAALAAVVGVAFWRERDLRRGAERARVEAAAQATRAEAVAGFMRTIVSAADPALAQGRDLTVVEVLDQAAEQFERDAELTATPALEASLRRTLGETYTALGRFAEAEAQLRRAAERLAGAPAAELERLAVDEALGDALLGLGRADAAEAIFRRALGARTAADGAKSATALADADRLAHALWKQRRLDEAEALDRETLEARRRALGHRHPDTLSSINSLATTLYARGAFDEAAALFEEALAVRLPQQGASHPEVLKLSNNLGAAYVQLGRYREAVPLQRRVVDMRTRVLGAEHPLTSTAVHNLGLTLLALARFDEAERLLRRAIAIRDGFATPNGALFSRSFLADLELERGNLAAAERILFETLERQRREVGPDDPDTLRTEARIAELRLRQGRPAAAERRIRATLLRQRAARTDGGVDRLSGLLTLARALVARGATDDADRLAREVEAAARADLPDDHPLVVDALEIRAGVALATGDADGARELLDAVVESRTRSLGDAHPSTVRARRRLADL